MALIAPAISRHKGIFPHFFLGLESTLFSRNRSAKVFGFFGAWEFPSK